MSSQQRIEWHLVQTTNLSLGSPLNPSVLVRTARFAGLDRPDAMESTVDLTRLLAVSFTTLDGEHRSGLDVIAQKTVLILIDAYRAKPERSAAEIGWVRERIDPAVDLVLIWPSRISRQARMFPGLHGVRMYLDSRGEFRRLVSPTGKRIALLIDPDTGSIERLSGASPIFAIGRGNQGAENRGVDRMIDLGDVYH